jgi:hypothetical protein
MVIFGNENDYTTDFYGSNSFVVYLSGLVLRRKDNMTLSAQFSNSGQIITYLINLMWILQSDWLICL